MDLTILDTIVELRNAVSGISSGERLFVIVGISQLRELEALPEAYRSSSLTGHLTTVVGLPVICIPSYDGIAIVPEQDIIVKPRGKGIWV